jgi:type I restriction enzyme S subunit
MQEKAKEPEIRFAGFTGAWEQRKLSDIAERITRKNTHLESTLPLTISSSYGLIDQYAYFNNRVASRNTRNYYLIKNGEFAYNKSYSDGFPFGSVKRLDRYAMGVLSTLYIIFSIDYRKVNSDFLVSYYDTKNWHHQVALRAAEGARNHGLLNISADDFFETELKIPMNLDEQKKIGSFFDQLNSFITLHQRKYEKLLNIKKSMLEKMFPKEGEVVPEIRFKGFTGAWEQRKLGDVLEFLKDGTHGTHPDADQGPLLLSAKNIKNGDVTWDDTDRKISQAEFDMIHSNFKLKKGDVLLTIVGSIGESAILKDPHEITFQRSVAFLRPNKTITSGFLYSEIQGEKFQTELNNRKSTSAQPGIYLGDLSEIPLDTPPNLKEQEEIGKFFSEINSLLTLHQRKLEMLKNVKQAFLEKMFV